MPLYRILPEGIARKTAVNIMNILNISLEHTEHTEPNKHLHRNYLMNSLEHPQGTISHIGLSLKIVITFPELKPELRNNVEAVPSCSHR